MSKKQDAFYFDNFIACAEYSCRAAHRLREVLTDFRPDEISEKFDEIHEIERQADEERHELNDMLIKAFITPIEREDIAALSHDLDEVTDKIEDVLIHIEEKDVLQIIAWREIYDYMEKCADACEHAADVIGSVVMKNS